MSSAGGAHITYASRKRRKPVQKTVKPAPLEGVKSNPSKRHRDRLNTELDRLASLLPFPQDVISKLDKLSVLRLSVSYLRAKSFFDVALKSSQADLNGSRESSRGQLQDSLRLQEGELLLQALSGFVLVVTTDALVFYASSTIQDYLGFQQSDIIHQSVFELIHTEDRAEFQRQLHWTLKPGQAADSAPQGQEGHGLSQTSGFYNPEQLPPENSPFLERCFICRLRCLLDNSSGFLAMNFQGRLKLLHGQNKKAKDGSSLAPQLALFAVATPLQPPSILEIRTKNFIFRTKHKLDFSPTGCDAKGRLILGYTEAELCTRGSGYQFIHAADMLYCADNHLRMIKTGESGMTVFRLLTKENRWVWVQSNARLIYKNGRPDYIIATQRPLTDEEGTEHLQKRHVKLPFSFATGEAVLYEVTFSFPALMDPTLGRTKGPGARKDDSARHPQSQDSFHPGSVLAAMLQQDESVYLCPPAPHAAPLQRDFGAETAEDLSGIVSGDWQESLMPLGGEDVLQQEQMQLSHEAGLEPTGPFPENRNSELHSIMRSLGIDFEDVRRMQQDEFFRIDFSGGDDIRDIDLTDEILTYVQTSLNKSTFSHSGPQPQPLLHPQASLQQQHPLQIQPPVRPQPPLQSQPPLQQQPLLHPQPPMQQQPLLQPQPPLQQQPLLHPQPPLQQQQPLLQPQPPLQQQSLLHPQHPLQQQHPLQPQPLLHSQPPLQQQPPLQSPPLLHPQPPLQQQHPLQPQPPLQQLPQGAPHIPSSSCMVQEQLEQQRRQQQQHLCQKMKHLQVGGVLASWRPGDPEPFPCPQPESQSYDVFPDAEFPYKSEFSTLPYTQGLLSYSQALFSQPPTLSHLDFPVGSFEQPPYPMSHLGDFASCLPQTPENAGYGGHSQPTLSAPPSCYAGAVSMFQCQPEGQASSEGPMHYNPMASSQNTSLDKFQNGLNGDVLNETYPAQLDGLNDPQAAACLRQAEARPFPDLPSSGFL
ncbi:aryl hydrocarbon receptor [Phascolarctos cinereus]|uniref:Aryl hydrocarbon receptor n=1 Tax=Phascolarctos cinereus TaxID=38626 RepID=A0A6P5LCI0_PHACI|nr:aryl hydrocarbon receptor [Phascolarctos cinereus]